MYNDVVTYGVGSKEQEKAHENHTGNERVSVEVEYREGRWGEGGRDRLGAGGRAVLTAAGVGVVVEGPPAGYDGGVHRNQGGVVGVVQRLVGDVEVDLERSLLVARAAHVVEPVLRCALLGGLPAEDADRSVIPAWHLDVGARVEHPHSEVLRDGHVHTLDGQSSVLRPRLRVVQTDVHERAVVGRTREVAEQVEEVVQTGRTS